MTSYRIIILLLILISCNRPKDKNAAQYRLIPKKEFTSLLVKYHLAEAIGNSSQFRMRYKKVKEISLTDSVIKQAGYTRKDFDSTIAYYSSRPSEYDLIYEQVVTSLSRLEAKSEKKGRENRNQPPAQKQPATNPAINPQLPRFNHDNRDSLVKKIKSQVKKK